MGLFTYILRCSDDSFYVGVTNSMAVRLQQHNSCMNSSCYTAKRVPVILVWYNYFDSNTEAINWEKKLKGWTKKKKQALIDQKFDLLHEYSKCQNWSSSEHFHASTPHSVTSPSTPLRRAQGKPLSVTDPSTTLQPAPDKLLSATDDSNTQFD